MTRQGIVVSTWSGGEDSCKVLLKSLWNVRYPVMIAINDSDHIPKDWWQKLYYWSGEQDWIIHELPFDGYEIGALESAMSRTDWDEFVLLQDTIEVKDQDVFNLMFEELEGKSVAYNPHFQMYLGKYRRDILEKMVFPQVRTKAEAVRQEEIFAKQYQEIDKETEIFNPRFRDENFYDNWEEMFGRKNLKLEDDYLIKRKGTWSAGQLI